jgi:hypothetical protein
VRHQADSRFQDSKVDFDVLFRKIEEVRDEILQRIEERFTQQAVQQPAKEFYTTAEVVEIVGRADYTIREWCRLGRIAARKKPCGRGRGGEWLISQEELTRYRNEGLRPGPRTDN